MQAGIGEIYSLTERAVMPGFVAKRLKEMKTEIKSLFIHLLCKGVCVLLLLFEQHDGGIGPREAAFTSTEG